MKATFGKYVDVNLSTGAITDYPIPTDWLERFIGGKGVASRLLIEDLPEHVDAFGEENILVFATGPFQGTGLVGAGRHAVLAVSPKTGRVADTYAGGFFGHELGRSGYDGILVRGISDQPVVLALIDGEASLVPADDLWGSGTGETEQALTSRFPGAKVSSIGIAGERLVSQSCIINDRSRASGRPGFGAVMGAKRLKAVVVRGHEEKTLHDAGRFATERSEYLKTFTEDEGFKEFGEYGTSSGVTALSEMGILPTKNFQEGVFDDAEAIGGRRMHDTILVDRDTCAGCPVRCKRAVKTTFAGLEVLPEFGGPEYETLGAFGSLCLNADLDAIALANQLCNDHGLDTISAGTTIAFLMEASEKGLIDEEIAWGDANAIVRLVEQIAKREGIGDRVADGLDAFAREIGADFAMTIKGVELPMHEPRGKQGLGISYATTPRGANHMEGLHDTMIASGTTNEELGVDKAYSPLTLKDKPRLAKAFEDVRSFDNSLVVCCFTSRSLGENYSYPRIRSLLEAASGLRIDAAGMMHVGERAQAALRILSGREGHRIEDDGLPTRFSKGLPRGGSADHPIDPDDMRLAIADYYALRGYDRFGPTDETLRRLDMDDCVGRIDRDGDGGAKGDEL
ncbi:MAG: aldehyde ferredoxin oxidoreductase family protein [Candidatus Bipolaricaulia bacterium]